MSACLICIGSNDHRKENFLLARQNLYALFPSIYFATEMETEPLYLKNTARFSIKWPCLSLQWKKKPS